MEGIIPALSVLAKKGVTKTQYIVDITSSTWFATQIAFNGAMAMYAISSRNSASTLVDIAEDKTVISYNTNLLNAKVENGYVYFYTSTLTSGFFTVIVYT